MKYSKEFRRDCPETIGGLDHTFDLHNYSEWLEKEVKKLRDMLSEEPPNQIVEGNVETTVKYMCNNCKSKLTVTIENIKIYNKYNLIVNCPICSYPT